MKTKKFKVGSIVKINEGANNLYWYHDKSMKVISYNKDRVTCKVDYNFNINTEYDFCNEIHISNLYIDIKQERIKKLKNILENDKD
jgi:hypothetical protein